MLLSDHAQVANGKLYVLGAGWTHSLHVDTPMPLAVAVQLDIPWTAANEKHSLSLELTDDDGNASRSMGHLSGSRASFRRGDRRVSSRVATCVS